MTRRDTILLVDDLPSTVAPLIEVMEAAGYTVLLAASAIFALTVIERITPDLVLIDAIMPGMDGFELCRVMKRHAALSAVPIIFMTGLTETEHVVRGFEAGGVDYVTKPVVATEVVARINVHLVNARRTLAAQTALDAAGRFLIAVTPEGTVLWATPQAAALVRDAAGAGPGPLLAWPSGSDINPADLESDRCVASIPMAGARLEMRFVGRFGPDEWLLRVVRRTLSSAEDLLRARLGLTQREAEVLLWISRGKSNRDIGDILGMRPSTVTKHLEQVYNKLGVENRASATAMALRSVGEA